MDLDDLGTAPLVDEAAQAFIDRCRDMAEDERTAYAADTLLGIAKTVEAKGQFTLAQINAVDNIADGAKKREYAERSERRYERSRRYEGWRR